MKNIKVEIRTGAPWNDNEDMVGLFIEDLESYGFEYKGDVKIDREWYSVFFKNGVLYGFASAEDILVFIREEL